MSFHFKNGTTYGPTTDSSPATIIIDPLATIQSFDPLVSALTLKNFPWSVDAKGTVFANGIGIHLIGDSDIYTSDVRVAAGARIASQMESGILASHATNVTNAGVISGGAFGIQEAGKGSYAINNLATGVIYSNKTALYLRGPGTHEVTNAGKIEGSGFAIFADGGGVEKIANSGRISGPVNLGDGNDTFTNFIGTKSGTLFGGIDLGAGDDIFNGGAFLESVLDGAGKDTVKLGGGDDEWVAFLGKQDDGADVVDGGSGIDTYDAYRAGTTNGVIINLDTVAHAGKQGGIADDFDEGTPAETIRNFENAIGTGARDFIYGSGAKNELAGGGGNDFLYGLGGSDKLYGGSGADRFVYLALSDSKVGAANRDTIQDFQRGSDLIDLYSIDAKSRVAGNQEFKFIGTQAFHKVQGELHYKDLGATCLVQGDVNGDGKADFEILVKVDALSAGDFVL